MTSISKIIKNDMCLGCGLCAAIDKHCTMQIAENGFYRPVPVPTDAEKVKKINRLCPGIRVEQTEKVNTDVWGNVETVVLAWAANEENRHLSSSGGVTSALAIYLLETHQVDGVLHVGHVDGDYLHNKLYISRTRDEVLSRNQSRYAPAKVFDELLDILDRDKNKKYCFIGKPCDVAAMHNLLRDYPCYTSQIPFCLAIFCAGMPSYNATLQAISTFDNPSTPVALRYRGDGWPGYFKVKFADGSTNQMTYQDSWGKILGRQVGFRCKICPDGIGLLADIASGDAWHTKDGYPDFSESAGRNFCFVRTVKGEKLIEDAVQAGYIYTENLDINHVKEMQPYQYKRRHYVAWRVAVVQCLTFCMLHFKGLGIYRLSIHSNIICGMKEALGTVTRFVKMRNIIIKDRWKRA